MIWNKNKKKENFKCDVKNNLQCSTCTKLSVSKVLYTVYIRILSTCKYTLNINQGMDINTPAHMGKS